MMCTRDGSSRNVGGIGTAWSRVISNGYTVMVWDMEIMRKNLCGSYMCECVTIQRKKHRHACNQAMNSNFNQLSRRINDLYRGRHMKRLWNLIRSTKRDRSMHDDICVSDLHKYFSAKFCDSEYTNDVIIEAER